MLQRRVRFLHVLRAVMVALSVLGLLAMGIVLAIGALRGETARRAGESVAEPAGANIPPMDRQTPEDVETATFALG